MTWNREDKKAGRESQKKRGDEGRNELLQRRKGRKSLKKFKNMLHLEERTRGK